MGRSEHSQAADEHGEVCESPGHQSRPVKRQASACGQPVATLARRRIFDDTAGCSICKRGTLQCLPLAVCGHSTHAIPPHKPPPTSSIGASTSRATCWLYCWLHKLARKRQCWVTSWVAEAAHEALFCSFDPYPRSPVGWRRLGRPGTLPLHRLLKRSQLLRHFRAGLDTVQLRPG